MSALRKEWTKEEIERLDRDMKVAKAKVLSEHGFTAEEIEKVLDLPQSVIRTMLDE